MNLTSHEHVVSLLYPLPVTRAEFQKRFHYLRQALAVLNNYLISDIGHLI